MIHSPYQMLSPSFLPQANESYYAQLPPALQHLRDLILLRQREVALQELPMDLSLQKEESADSTGCHSPRSYCSSDASKCSDEDSDIDILEAPKIQLSPKKMLSCTTC